MTRCWAECLGNCGGPLTREHIVSENLFEGKHVIVQGFPWCRNDSVKIAMTGFTGKILCGKHNNDLSPVDAAAGQGFAAIGDMLRISAERAGLDLQTISLVEYHIDGKLLERWFLKTLINTAFGQNLPIGSPIPPRGCPTEELVRIAFGLQGFAGRAGLYATGFVGEPLYQAEGVELRALIQDGAYIIGSLFGFRGFRFVLSLIPEGPPSLSGLGFVQGEEWGSSQLVFHIQTINDKHHDRLSQAIRFAW